MVVNLKAGGLCPLRTGGVLRHQSAFCGGFFGFLSEMGFAPFWLPRWMKRSSTGRPRLAVVTCIKNEGEDLVEWLCFHRHIGVSRFVVYDNLSTDATARILESVPFRKDIALHKVAEESAQKFAFRDAIRRYSGVLDWAAFIDGDEFIVPLGEASIIDRLAELETRGVNGFGVHWRIFGSSGHKSRPPGLITETFTRRAPDAFSPNRHVKSVVRMSAIESMVTQHYFRVRGTYLLDDGSRPGPDFEGIGEQASFSQGFALHHYITKSHEQCMRKIARGRPRPSNSKTKFRPPDYWTRYNRNDVEDSRAAQVIAPIRDDVLELRQQIERATRTEADDRG